MSKIDLKRRKSALTEDEQSEEILVEMDLPVVAKRARFTYQEKMQILEDSKSLKTLNLCEKYNINERTLRKWKQIQDNIKEASLNNNFKNCKKKGNTAELDDTLYDWYVNALHRGVLVTGTLLRKQAIIINRNIKGETDFKASNGWLDRWKCRKNVKLPQNSKASNNKIEFLPLELSHAEQIKADFEDMIRTRNLERSQIFSLEESYVQFLMTSRNFSIQKDKEKQCNEMTIVGCCNADSSLNLPLIAIGKSEKPQCFKNLKHYQLPIWYRSQENSTMDLRIFKEWFMDEFVPIVETFLTSKNLSLSAILLVKHCEPYKNMKINKVNEIEIIFLPTDVTSLEDLLY